MTAFMLTTVTALYLVSSMLLLAAYRPGYRAIRDTISELGETGARHGRLAAYGVFLPVGLMALALAWLRHGSSAAGLALCIAVGYLAAAAFPCDPGSPARGTWRQSLHNLGGLVEYWGGGIFLWRLGADHDVGFQALAAFVLALPLAFNLRACLPIRGLLQRLAESALFGGLLLANAGA